MTKQNADIITINGIDYPADVVTHYMDDALREEMHSEDWESEQAFVDAYAVRHAERFGEPFVVN